MDETVWTWNDCCDGCWRQRIFHRCITSWNDSLCNSAIEWAAVADKVWTVTSCPVIEGRAAATCSHLLCQGVKILQSVTSSLFSYSYVVESILAVHSDIQLSVSNINFKSHKLIRIHIFMRTSYINLSWYQLLSTKAGKKVVKIPL